MHSLILGRTGSGKSLFGRQLADAYARNGIASIVLDPIGDPRWPPSAHLATRSPSEFLFAARQSQRCALFIDESGEAIGQHNTEMFWLATRARHLGHCSHFLAQRAAMISPTVRDQCELLICFAVSREDSVILAREWSDEALAQAHRLPQFHYLAVRRFGATTAGEVRIPTREPAPQVPATQDDSDSTEK